MASDPVSVGNGRWGEREALMNALSDNGLFDTSSVLDMQMYLRAATARRTARTRRADKGVGIGLHHSEVTA